jgi:hypothetical protein
MAALDWIHLLMLGGVLGLLGQGLRVVAGLKKVHDDVASGRGSFAEQFEPSRLLVSLLIGFIAGALAIISLKSGDQSLKVSTDLVITLIAAGYAGTDFIEAFIKAHLPAAESVASRRAAQSSGS